MEASETCAVCGNRTSRKYLGVMVCSPCKMFFKRNAKINQGQLKCHFDGHCEITAFNRHTCCSCRLKKCVASGMQADLLRGPLSKKNRPKSVKITSDSQVPISNAVVRSTDPQQLPTLNLLRSDQSTLSVDQWTLLSNLIHCYDELNGFSVVECFVNKQNALPVRSRIKLASIDQLCTSLMAGAHLLFEKNADFVSLSASDRSLLLHGKTKYVGCLGGLLVLNNFSLLNDLAFCQASEVVYGPQSLAGSQSTCRRIDPVIIFMKLVLAIILFSTFDYTVYENTPRVNFDSVQSVLRVRDAYAELAWRYLLYKYDYAQAVVRFSNVIRCIFALNDAIVYAVTRTQYTNVVDNLIKQTEEALSLNK